MNNIVVENGKTYTLAELVTVDIDSWVNAIGKLDDDPRLRDEALAMAGEEKRKEWERMDMCPGELEDEYTAIANRDKYRFNSDGNIVSFEKYRK